MHSIPSSMTAQIPS